MRHTTGNLELDLNFAVERHDVRCVIHDSGESSRPTLNENLKILQANFKSMTINTDLKGSFVASAGYFPLVMTERRFCTYIQKYHNPPDSNYRITPATTCGAFGEIENKQMSRRSPEPGSC